MTKKMTIKQIRKGLEYLSKNSKGIAVTINNPAVDSLNGSFVLESLLLLIARSLDDN